ncbi:MAG: Asp-tRNA(Asn)/Glu-tRNA(Gln) amidotransferase subunit GatC [Rickettsiales bacterium]|nr:Asp-tRNA(Asn)/Glu-tRNA(Gln) amidotransferase subunit GatC [Rickettsiales bacterium]
MTNINKDQIVKIANLARIRVSEEESLQYADDLSDIISWVESLNKLDTESVKPMMSVESDLIMRDDDSDDNDYSSDVLKNSPDQKLNFYVVPKFVG